MLVFFIYFPAWTHHSLPGKAMPCKSTRTTYFQIKHCTVLSTDWWLQGHRLKPETKITRILKIQDTCPTFVSGDDICIWCAADCQHFITQILRSHRKEQLILYMLLIPSMTQQVTSERSQQTEKTLGNVSMESWEQGHYTIKKIWLNFVLLFKCRWRELWFSEHLP